MYHGRIPTDPKGQIDRLQKRLADAQARLDQAKMENHRENISRHSRKVIEIERELNNWRHLQK
jgi:hypothetical protein